MFDFFKKRKEKKIRKRKFHDKYRFEMKIHIHTLSFMLLKN